MQNVTLINDCLFFKYQQKNYLYRVTRHLAFHYKQVPQIDCVLMPSQSYSLILNSFGWFYDSILKVNPKSVQIRDSKIVKILEQVQNIGKIIKFQQWKQHDFTESDLIKLLQKLLQQQNKQISIKTITQLPSASWFNNSHQQFNLIFPQYTTTSVICNRNSIMLIDCQQKIINTLQLNYKIPLKSIQTVLLTNSNLSTILGFTEIFFNVQRFSLITTETIYKQLQKIMKILFKIDEDKITTKVHIKILKINQQMISNEIKFKYSNEQTIFDVFIMKIQNNTIKIYPQELKHYPKNIDNIQLIILYEIGQNMKNTLRSLPQSFRKRIILNRPTHKYYHKYFYTLTPANNIILFSTKTKIILPNILSLSNNLSSQQLVNYEQYMNIKLLKDQQFNGMKRVVIVHSGYLKNSEGIIYGAGQKIIDDKTLIACGNVIVFYWNSFQFAVIQSNAIIDKKLNQNESKLKNIKQNSFIESLSDRQFEDFDRLAHNRTYQADQTISTHNKDSKIFFIIKGGLKWSDSKDTIGKGEYIGDVASFYQQDESQIEIFVVKDTWVIQLQLKDLDSYFFNKWPKRLIQLISKGKSFR